MASVVDQCNQALSNIGAAAGVTSINPPDGGAYAAHCARFYPIARDTALEAHPWKFAIKRFGLSQVAGASIPGQWEYAYGLPSDLIRPMSVLPEEYGDDFLDRLDYEIEASTLYCNSETAILKYIARVTDTTKWPQSFSDCVVWKLSQLLAGVVVKGSPDLRSFCEKQYMNSLAIATGFNANSSQVRPTHTPIWMSDR